MWQAVVDLAKVCVEEKVAAGAAGWGVMEGQVVGRHPEGSGGSPLPPPCSQNPLSAAHALQWVACSSSSRDVAALVELIAGQQRATGLSLHISLPAILLLQHIYVAVAAS